MVEKQQVIRASFALALAVTAMTICGRAENPVDSSAVTPVPVKEARRQAELLHATIHSTLHLVHHQLYREDEGLPLPAAVFRDAFRDLETREHVKLQWLAVEGQAMNMDHVARTPFEKQAVVALKAGDESVEEVSQGVYHRAAPILLTNQCLKCHVPDRKSTENRVAGLIISIPVTE